MCIVQIQSVCVNFACTKGLFNLLAEANIRVRNVGLCARCAIFLLKIKQIPFSCRLVRGFTFWKRAQNQFKRLLEISIVLASNDPTEGSSFYVKRAHTDDKNRQNKFFLCQKRMNLVPIKQLLPNVPFQSTKYRKKEFCVENKYERLSEMCFVQHVEKKSVFTFQTIKRLVSFL